LLSAAESPDPGAWKTVNGFYSLAVQRSVPATTLLVADRRGSIPIFYTRCGHLLLFASEPKALFVCRSIPREFDRTALAAFLTSGHCLGEQTLFPSVHRLRGGQFLQIGEGRIKLATYWQYQPGAAAENENDMELREELAELVERATVRNLGPPDKAVIFISGGTDSRGILGGCLEAVQGEGARLNTVCWGVDRGQKNSDVQIAEVIASHYGLKHSFVRREIADYGMDFSEANRLIDASADIAAHHPYEHRIMESLMTQGFQRVLRGDEVFGWSFSAKDISSAMALVGLGRFRDLECTAQFLRAGLHHDLCDASDASIDAYLAEVDGLSPNQAKDYLYYSHRLQGYLNSASYYKQLFLDQRNCLLDETILDFMSRVPDRLRIDKLLYRQAMYRAYPHLWRFPHAKCHNLENWAALLRTDSPVRAFVASQLNDSSSGIWELFDQAALKAEFERMTMSTAPNKIPGRRPSLVQPLLQGVFHRLPKNIISFVQSKRTLRLRSVPYDTILMRVMVLKHCYDTLVEP
jgi:asparagine synthetase B (glutamine-hydrolysing)